MIIELYIFAIDGQGNLINFKHNKKKLSFLGFKIQMVKWLKLKQNKNTSITNTKTIRDKTKQITSELKKRITSLREEIKKKY